MCASALRLSEADGRDRLNCPKCGWIDYRNPLPVVACLVSNDDGDLLLIKRGIEPCRGSWALPGGFIEAGETIQDAGERELFEETGLQGVPERLVGVHVQESQLYGPILMVGIEYIPQGRELAPGDDASEAKFIPRGKLPEIPFESHHKLISEFFS